MPREDLRPHAQSSSDAETSWRRPGDVLEERASLLFPFWMQILKIAADDLPQVPIGRGWPATPPWDYQTPRLQKRPQKSPRAFGSTENYWEEMDAENR